MVSLQYLEANEVIKPQEFGHEVSDIIFKITTKLLPLRNGLTHISL